MSDCEIIGSAMAMRNLDGGINWVVTDPEIHVAMELLEDSEARKAIEVKYEIGEICPHYPHSRHARLKAE